MWWLQLLFVLLQYETIVFEAAVAPAQNLHLVIPFIITVENGFYKVRLSVGDVQEIAIVFQNTLNLVLSDI